jgi:hypothetical protein
MIAAAKNAAVRFTKPVVRARNPTTRGIAYAAQGSQFSDFIKAHSGGMSRIVAARR